MFQAVRVAAFIGLLLTVAESATAQSGYQVVRVGSPGTITGMVKWSGPMPRVPVLPITKNPDICDPTSRKKRDLERLIVGPQGGVANTVVFLKNISKGKAMDLPEARSFLNQRNCRYEPHILLVAQNAALQMKSSDPILHTIHMDGAAAFNLPFPFPNRVVSRTMQSQGLVNLKCNAGHVWMNAEILVAPHPYYAVTDEDGRFALTGVPPGQYQIVAWHEGWAIAREEEVFDVLTEQRVRRPIFTEPKTWEKKVTVGENDTAMVNFVLNDK